MLIKDKDELIDLPTNKVVVSVCYLRQWFGTYDRPPINKYEDYILQLTGDVIECRIDYETWRDQQFFVKPTVADTLLLANTAKDGMPVKEPAYLVALVVSKFGLALYFRGINNSENREVTFNENDQGVEAISLDQLFVILPCNVHKEL